MSRIIEFPAERFIQEYSFLNNIPAWSAWLIIIMISAVAGICEEIGFRGYMQVPIGKKYGPVVAISIVSIVFVIVHLHQAWSGIILVHIFFVSVLFGTIAYFTQSLIPGIIAHFIMDFCNFSFWWSTLGIQFDRRPIAETGLDTHLFIWAFVLMGSIGLFALVMFRVRMTNREILS